MSSSGFTGRETAATNATSRNVSSSVEEDGHQKVVVEIVYVIIFVLATAGNFAMVFILRQRRRRRRESPSNLLLFHVVISEMCVLVLNIPFDMVLIYVGHRWIFGSVMCKILWPLQTLSLGSFVWILTLLSYQRYRGIVCPLERKLSTRKLNQIVATVWLFSLLAVVPYGAFLEYRDNDCIETWSLTMRQCFTIIFFVIQYALPLVVTMYCYMKIAVVVRRGHSSVRRHISGTVQAGFRHKRRSFSAIRTAVLFTTIFAICMLPHQVIWLWLEFGNYQNDIRQLLTFAYIFTFTSVFMNPMVYIFSTPSVRKELFLKARALRRRSSGSSENRFLKKFSFVNSGSGVSMV